MEVAIQKCPYCKAIIDEGEEYCTNCGTKLLFEEDDSIEEEIPGEKIVEEEEKEKKRKSTKQSSAAKKKAASRKKTEKETTPAEKKAVASKKKPESPAKKKKKAEKGEKKNRKRSEKAEEAVVIAEELEKQAAEIVPELPEQEPEFVDFPPPEAEEQELDYVPDGDQDLEIGEEPDQVEGLLDEDAEMKEFEDFPAEPVTDTEAPAFEEEVPREEVLLEEEAQDQDSEKETDIYPDSPEEPFPGGEELPEFTDDQAVDPEDAPLADDQWEMSNAVEDHGEEDQQPEENMNHMLFAEEEQAEESPEQDKGIEFEAEDGEGEVEAVEKEKEEIEKFLDTLKKERQEVKENGVPPTGELPPWAASMKENQAEDADLNKEGVLEEAPVPEEETFEGAEKEIPLEEPIDVPPSEEFPMDEITPNEIPTEDMPIDEPALPDEMPVDEIHPDELPPDVPVNTDEIQPPDTDTELPETIDQQALPFDEEAATREKEKKKKKKPRQPRLSVSSWVRARIFDVLFIAGLWFISLWVASWMAEVTVIQLIKSSTLLLVCYYAILLVLYFFFFLFFLRETLGDNLFSYEE